MINSIQSGCYLLLVSVTVLSYFVILPVQPTLIACCVSIIYIGSTLSLQLKQHREKTGEKNEDTMSTKDAAMFPIMGSCMLFGLYVLFKFFDKDWVNFLLTLYFAILGTYSLTSTFNPLVERLFFSKANNSNVLEIKTPKIPMMGELDISISRSELLTGILSGIFAATWFRTRHFLLNNIFGIAFSIKGIESLSLGSYKVGAILLIGLFFYDIFWVFGTDVMVTVATSFDAPIKLLFKRELATATAKAKFSMIGLGDIVIPGIFIALLLRYDAHRAGISHAADTLSKPFPKTFFHTNLIAYTLGLVMTVVVMIVFKAAQPALLYLVPACLGASVITAAYLKDFKGLWEYSEEEEEESDGDESETETKKDEKKEAKKDK